MAKNVERRKFIREQNKPGTNRKFTVIVDGIPKTAPNLWLPKQLDDAYGGAEERKLIIHKYRTGSSRTERVTANLTLYNVNLLPDTKEIQKLCKARTVNFYENDKYAFCQVVVTDVESGFFPPTRAIFHELKKYGRINDDGVQITYVQPYAIIEYFNNDGKNGGLDILTRRFDGRNYDVFLLQEPGMELGSRGDENFAWKIDGLPPHATKQGVAKQLKEVYGKDVGTLISEGCIKDYDMKLETKRATVNIQLWTQENKTIIEDLARSKTLYHAKSVKVHNRKQYYQVVIEDLPTERCLYEDHLRKVFKEFGNVGQIAVENIPVYAIVKYWDSEACNEGHQILDDKYGANRVSPYPERLDFAGRNLLSPLKFDGYPNPITSTPIFDPHHIACYSVRQSDDEVSDSEPSIPSIKFTLPDSLRGELVDAFANLRYLREDQNMHLDNIQELHEKRKSRTRTDQSMDLLLQYVLTNKQLFEECDFVCIQGLLVKIGIASSVFDKGHEVVVQRVGRVHYMCNRATKEMKSEKAERDADERQRKQTEAGNAFEYAVTTNPTSKEAAKNVLKGNRKPVSENPNSSESLASLISITSEPPMNGNHDFFLIVQAELEIQEPGIKGKHQLAYASECDCFFPTKMAFGEIKLTKDDPKVSPPNVSAKCTIFKTWLQCYLGGINDIFYGIYKQEKASPFKITVEDKDKGWRKTSDIHKVLKDDVTIDDPKNILRNLYSFLSYVKESVKEDYRPFMFKRDKETVKWSCTQVKDEDVRSCRFLPRGL